MHGPRPKSRMMLLVALILLLAVATPATGSRLLQQLYVAPVPSPPPPQGTTPPAPKTTPGLYVPGPVEEAEPSPPPASPPAPAPAPTASPTTAAPSPPTNQTARQQAPPTSPKAQPQPAAAAAAAAAVPGPAPHKAALSNAALGVVIAASAVAGLALIGIALVLGMWYRGRRQRRLAASLPTASASMGLLPPPGRKGSIASSSASLYAGQLPRGSAGSGAGGNALRNNSTGLLGTNAVAAPEPAGTAPGAAPAAAAAAGWLPLAAPAGKQGVGAAAARALQRGGSSSAEAASGIGAMRQPAAEPQASSSSSYEASGDTGASTRLGAGRALSGPRELSFSTTTADSGAPGSSSLGLLAAGSRQQQQPAAPHTGSTAAGRGPSPATLPAELTPTTHSYSRHSYDMIGSRPQQQQQQPLSGDSRAVGTQPPQHSEHGHVSPFAAFDAFASSSSNALSPGGGWQQQQQQSSAVSTAASPFAHLGNLAELASSAGSTVPSGWQQQQQPEGLRPASPSDRAASTGSPFAAAINPLLQRTATPSASPHLAAGTAAAATAAGRGGGLTPSTPAPTEGQQQRRQPPPGSAPRSSSSWLSSLAEAAAGEGASPAGTFKSSSTTASHSAAGGSSASNSVIARVLQSGRQRSDTPTSPTGHCQAPAAPPHSVTGPAGTAAGSSPPRGGGGGDGGGGAPLASGGDASGPPLRMQDSVAQAAAGGPGHRPTRHMSGCPQPEPNWDFGRTRHRPVKVLLQVTPEAPADRPLSLILLVSAPPPRPEVLAHIILPQDPPQAGIDMAIDANTTLAFPNDSFLGQGAFGQVHRAVYKGCFPVAVKMLTDPGLRNPDAETLRSFREELAIMGRLNHPNILRCYGGNLEPPNPFIVTELCVTSLDRVISYHRKKYGSGLPLRHTLTVGLHIASALWHLHPSIVHRDLKPQNVLLDEYGTAKVADFGLSRMKVHTYLSTQHLQAGTACYMAPECFAGEHVGVKADLYSLGCLLLECITGERPWFGLNVVQVAYQVAMAHNTPLLPPAHPNAPQELLSLIAECFAANPRERPSSGEVMKSLAHMLRIHFPQDV